MLTIACLFLSVIVHFDGSLRSTFDRGFTTNIQHPRASCAASIQFDIEGKDMSLGGKLLTCASSSTSAESEYEGLLLGLERLRDLSMLESSSVQRGITFFPTAKSDLKVQVFGDCKTVIQQMNGLSRPRKLEIFQARARDLITEIKETHPHAKFHFQHVPRAENILCDRLSAIIVREKQRRDYETVLLAAKNELSQVGNPESTRRFLGCFLSKDSHEVPFSRRPLFYRLLAHACCRREDWTSLLFVTGWWKSELSEVWPREARGHPSTEGVSFTSRDALLAEVVSWELLALKQLGETKKSAKLERKHRHLLRRFGDEVRVLPLEEKLDRALWLVKDTELQISANMERDTDKDELGNPWPEVIEEWYNSAENSTLWTGEGSHWLLSSQ